MEPLAAVSLAGNVAQFVQFSHSLITGTSEILLSHSGRRDRVVESQNLAELARQRVQSLAQELNLKSSEPSTNYTTSKKEAVLLRKLCESCCAVAEELTSLLETLTIKDKHGSLCTWKALYIAIQGELKKSNVQDLENRLYRISHELNTHVQQSQTKRISEQLKLIEEENHRLESSRSKDILQLQKDLNRAKNEISQNVLNLQEAWTSLSGVCIACDDLTIEQRILGSLNFPTIDHRRHEIASAHIQTFEWIFKANGRSSPDATIPDVNFTEWLGSVDQSVYWVSGKPGSGKSTLMKYIFDNPQTGDLLRNWAGQCDIIVVGYFFWAAANNVLQKSQEGLLRSILYNILRKRPNQIRSAFPDLWDFYERSRKEKDRTSTLDVSSLSSTSDVPSLLKAFSRISNSLESYNNNIFFVLDGLDECEGHPKEIITLLNLMRTSNNLKFCLSSRSWPDFEEAYGMDNPWRLYMHEVTKEDIAKYVHYEFEQDRKYRRLQENDENCPDLVRDIVEAARGVFLWVYLVVNSLLDGLTNDDRIEDLQRRLQLLPSDLEKLFEHILDSIPPFYREQSARVLKVADATSEQLPLMTYWYIDQGNMPQSNELKSPDTKEISFRVNQMTRRLNALSKGLLEAKSYQPSWLIDSLGIHNKLFDPRVNFLHRTVVDYLRKPHIKARLDHWIENGTEINLSICIGIFAHITAIPIQYQSSFNADGPLNLLLSAFYHHIVHIPNENVYQQMEWTCLSRMESVLMLLDRGTDYVSKTVLPAVLGLPYGIDPRLAPVCLGLTRYATSVKDLHRIQYSERGALEYLLFHGRNSRRLGKQEIIHQGARYEEMLKILLEKGCRPDERCGSSIHGTVWTVYLSRLLTLKYTDQSHVGFPLGHRKNLPELRFTIIMNMIQYGARTKGDFMEYPGFQISLKEAVQKLLTPEEFSNVSHFWGAPKNNKSHFRNIPKSNVSGLDDVPNSNSSQSRHTLIGAKSRKHRLRFWLK